MKAVELGVCQSSRWRKIPISLTDRVLAVNVCFSANCTLPELSGAPIVCYWVNLYGERLMTSLSKNARVAALLYILTSPFAIVHLMYIPSHLSLSRNAPSTT